MKGTIKVLNRQGHTEVAYDTEAGVVDEAERVLAEANHSNAALFDAKTKEQVQHPDISGASEGRRALLEEHEGLLVVSPLQGGGC